MPENTPTPRTSGQDVVEQARQHVASFQAIGGTVAYPFSVRLAMRVIAQADEIERLRESIRDCKSAGCQAWRALEKGSIGVGESDALIVARALLSQEGEGWRNAVLEEAAKVIEEKYTNNVGIIHPTGKSDAKAIRALKSLPSPRP